MKNINSIQENILKDINKVFNYQFENENLEIKNKELIKVYQTKNKGNGSRINFFEIFSKFKKENLI